MKAWKRLTAGLLSLTLAASLATAALAAEPKKEAAAKPAGQFTQWFPDWKTDPEAAEASEAVLASMGTVIQQSKTVGGETLTLNAAVWDGNTVQLSLTAKSPSFPAELDKNTWLYTEECWAKLPEEQWKEYVQNELDSIRANETVTEKEAEEFLQYKLVKLKENQRNYTSGPDFVGREGNTVNFKASVSLESFLEKPELTLHVENVAIYEKNKGSSVSIQDGERIGPGPDVPVLKGPFDFTFTLEKALPPAKYEGGVKVTFGKIPMRITEASVSATGISVGYAIDIAGPVHVLSHEEKPVAGKTNIDMDKDLSMNIEGVWTKDGKFVDCSASFAITGVMTPANGEGVTGTWERKYPYAIDPSTVTAVKIGGIRVELSGLKLSAK